MRTPVSLKGRVQIDVCDYLAIDDDEGIAVKKLARVVDSSARPQNLRLFDVVQFYPKPASIAECSTD